MLGVLDAVMKNPDSFYPAFCYSQQELDAESVSQLFETKFSEPGSNKRSTESLVISHWNDYLQDIEDKAMKEVTFNDVLFFACGCKGLPPFGIKLFLQFLHDVENYGEKSNFPKANTCSCILYLSVTHTTYEKFKDALTYAFLNTRGFGEP